MSFPRRFRGKNLIAVFKAHVETKDQSTSFPLLEGIELERLAWKGYIICVLEVFFFLKQKSAVYGEKLKIKVNFDNVRTIFKLI